MPKDKKRPVSRRALGQETRTRLIDAAEHLFTHSGYNGTSVREVALRAGVSLGVFGYHFASKDDLFREVIERRSHDHVAGVVACLDRLDAKAGNGDLTIDAVIRAFFQTSTDWFMRGDEGMRNYVVLIGRSMSLPYYDSFLEPLGEIYDPALTSLYRIVRRVFPDAQEERLHWSIYFLQAIFIHLMTQSRIVDRQSGDMCQSADLDTVLDELTPFLAAAFKARLVDCAAGSALPNS
ncbi:MAG: TetR/AcrR family transcriptional regulator [Sphingobium sp.]|nr:TetR/AcrR family transcriptional regulator [Sphingobium sp.]